METPKLQTPTPDMLPSRRALAEQAGEDVAMTSSASLSTPTPDMLPSRRHAKTLASLQAAQQTEPDRAALVERLSKKTGYDPEFVSENLSEFQKRQTQPTNEQLDELRDTAPYTYTMLNDKDTVALMQDDYQKMGFFESNFNKVVNAFKRAWKQDKLANLRIEQRQADLKNKRYTPGYDNEIELLTREIEEIPTPTGNWISRAPFHATEFGAQMLLSQPDAIAGAAVGGGTGAAVGAAVTAPAGGGGAIPGLMRGAQIGYIGGLAKYANDLEGGLAYGDLRELRDANGNPVPVEIAARASQTVGVINAALETAGDLVFIGGVLKPAGKLAGKVGGRFVGKSLSGTLGKTLSKIPGADNLVKIIEQNPAAFEGLSLRQTFIKAAKQWALTTASEVSTEYAQNVVQLSAEEVAKSASGQPFERRTFSGVMEESAQGMDDVLIGAGTLGLLGFGGNFHRHLSAVNQANRVSQLYTELGKGVKDLKLTARAPEKTIEFLAKQTNGTPLENLYIPVQAIDRVAEENEIDPHEFLQAIGPGVASQYDEAKATGGHIQVKTAAWAVQSQLVSKLTGKPIYESLASDVKADPDGYTQNELAQAQREVTDVINTQAEQLIKDGTAKAEELEQAKQAFLTQAAQAVPPDGMDSNLWQQQIEANAELYARLAVVEAHKRGQDFSEYAEHANLPIIQTRLSEGQKQAQAQAQELYGKLKAALTQNEETRAAQENGGVTPIIDYLIKRGGVRTADTDYQGETENWGRKEGNIYGLVNNKNGMKLYDAAMAVQEYLQENGYGSLIDLSDPGATTADTPDLIEAVNREISNYVPFYKRERYSKRLNEILNVSTGQFKTLFEKEFGDKLPDRGTRALKDLHFFLLREAVKDGLMPSQSVLNEHNINAEALAADNFDFGQEVGRGLLQGINYPINQDVLAHLDDPVQTVKVSLPDEKFSGAKAHQRFEKQLLAAWNKLYGQSSRGKSRTLTNKNTGWTATLSNTAPGEIYKTAINESAQFGPRIAYALASNIGQLFENAVLVKSHPDTEGRKNVKQVHRFFVPVKIDNKTYSVKLTVREFENRKVLSWEAFEENGERDFAIYTVAPTKEVALDGIYGNNSGNAEKVSRPTSNASNSVASGAAVVKLRDLLQGVSDTSGAYNLDENGNLLFQLGDEDLIATHAAKSARIDDILKSGQLIAPSIAITKKGQKELNKGNFGDITFVLNPARLNYDRDNVYNRDIYSPRLPTPVYKAPGFGYIDQSEYENYLRQWEENPEEFKKKYGGTFEEEIGNDKYIFEGFNERTGNRIYKKSTPANLLAYIKKESLLGGESWHYGLSSFLAKMSGQLNNREELRKESKKLTDREEAQKKYDELQKRYSDLLFGEIRKYRKFSDFPEEDFDDFLKNNYAGHPEKAAEYLEVEKIPAALKKELKAFVDDALNLPRSYFEAKPMRLVPLSDFVYAITKKGTLTKEQISQLESYGIEVKETEKGAADFDFSSLAPGGENDTNGLKVYFQRSGQRARGIFNDLTNTITLTPDANATTLTHELAHHWLNERWQYLNSGLADENYKKDFAPLAKYLEIKDGQEKLTRQQHEKFAKSFEAYLREGKAPSLELGRLFARLRRWMLRAYRDIKKELGVELNDDIRRTFDLMLATEEEVAAAERERTYEPYTKQPGLTDEDVKRLERLREDAHNEAVVRIMKEELEEMRFENDAKRAFAEDREYERVEQEFNNRPDYQLANIVESHFADSTYAKNNSTTTKTVEDGQEKEVVKLPTAQQLAKAFLENWMTDQERTTWTLIAESNGHTATGLAQFLSELPELDSAVAAEVARRMEKYGLEKDMRNLRRAKAQALSNEKALELLALEQDLFKNHKRTASMQRALELKALAKKAAHDWLAAKSARVAARYTPYFTAQKRAATRAARALARGDYETAAQAKTEELFNAAAASESIKISKRLHRVQEYFKFMQRKKINLLKKQEHYLQIADLLERLGYGRLDYNPGDKVESLAAYIKRYKDRGFDGLQVPDWIANESKNLDWRYLSMDSLQQVADAMKNINHTAYFEDRLFSMHRRQTITDLAVMVSQHLGKTVSNETREKYKDQVEPQKDGFLSGVTKYLYSMTKLDTLLHKADGYHDFGLMYELFMKPTKEAADRESVRLRTFKENYQKLIDSHYSKDEVRALFESKKYHPELGNECTKERLLVMALNMGNELNRQRLFNNPPVGFEYLTGRDGKSNEWTEESVQQLMRKNLTATDWDFVQGVWDLINEIWPDISEMHKHLTGFAPGKVEALPFAIATADGKSVSLRGGYFPIKYDWRGSRWAEREEYLAQPLYTEENQAWNATTKQGHTKARAKEVRQPLELNINLVEQHMTAVVHDLYFRPVVVDLRRMLDNDLMRDTLIRNLGRNGYDMLKAHLNMVATGGQETSGIGVINKMVEWLRKHTTIAVLAGKTSVIVENFANPWLFKDAIEGFTAKDVLKGMALALSEYGPQSLVGMDKAKEIREWVFAKSPMMKDKSENYDITMRQLKKTNIFGEDSALLEFTNAAMVATDDFFAVPMWITAYNKFNGEFLAAKKTEQEADKLAIERADKLIERVLGSGRRYDAAEIMRNRNALVRCLTMFATFMNNEFNRWSRETGLFLEQKDAIRYAGFVAGRLLVWHTMSQLLAGKWPEDLSPEELAKWWFSGLVDNVSGMFVGVRDILPVLVDKVMGWPSFGYRPTPISGTLEEMILRPAEAIGGFARGKKSGEQTAETVAKAASYLAPYPNQLNTWFFNAFDYVFNGMSPQARDFYRRRPKKERSK